MTPVSRAPWTDEQVVGLIERQLAPLHPYTCPFKNHSNLMLMPTNAGWVCPNRECEYTQDWAHVADVFTPRWWER